MATTLDINSRARSSIEGMNLVGAACIQLGMISGVPPIRAFMMWFWSICASVSDIRVSSDVAVDGFPVTGFLIGMPSGSYSILNAC